MSSQVSETCPQMLARSFTTIQMLVHSNDPLSMPNVMHRTTTSESTLSLHVEAECDALLLKHQPQTCFFCTPTVTATPRHRLSSRQPQQPCVPRCSTTATNPSQHPAPPTPLPRPCSPAPGPALTCQPWLLLYRQLFPTLPWVAARLPRLPGYICLRTCCCCCCHLTRHQHHSQWLRRGPRQRKQPPRQ